MSKAKQKLQYTCDHKNERFHFFASSIAEWSVNKNIDDLIKHMVKAGFPFAVWYVPTHVTAEYEIHSYTPDVEGRVFLGHWDFPEEN